MRRIVVVMAVLLGVLGGTVVASSAARTTAYADWGPLTGSSNDFATTMQLPAVGFPLAAVTTDSRADVDLPGGASNFFGPNTPPGLAYGSSSGHPYLNLRPRADNASSPSTTTYTFDGPTPQGWTFVLGDIDSDQVQVSATRADGTAATTAELGFRSTFNLCDTTPRPSGVCASNGRPKDVPTWNPATATLRGNDAALDSDGATGWFEPTTSLRTLTFTFTRRAGFPIFQTWFAVSRRDVTGVVAVTPSPGIPLTCDVEGATVSLVDAAGAAVAARTLAADGAYSFDGVAASDGYSVALSGLPADCVATSPSTVPIDLRPADATVPFAVRQVVPVAISGRVLSDRGGAPVPGAVVTIDDGTTTRTATTGLDGSYLFDTNVAGTYTLSVAPPDGFSTGTGPGPVTVLPTTTDPFVGQNFVLKELPTVSGTVSGPDGPVGGVTVELSDGGQTYRAVTEPDGTYTLPHVPAGTYLLRVPTPPAGYEVPAALPVTVGAADVPNQDVALTRAPAAGSVAGTVTLDGAPLPGAAVTVRPAGGTAAPVTSDAEGTFGVGGLVAGTYEIAVDRPAGTTGTATRTAVITAAGENLTGQDFAFTTAPTTPAPTTPAPTTPAPTPPVPDDNDGDGTDPDEGSGVAPDGDGVLPDSGGPSRSLPLLGLALLVGGAVTVVGSRTHRRDRSHTPPTL